MPSSQPAAAGAGFGVVIPYFQRQPGILARALQSVAAQTTRLPVSVVVVDDSSPVPAEGEVAAVDWPAHVRPVVLRQPNAGPGAARNTALDALPHVAYVALLDSDDAWAPDHLTHAQQALERGFDFYAGATADLDGRAATLAEIFGEPVPLRPLDWAPWAFELGAPLVDYTVRGPFVGPSTLVVTRALVGDTRFDRRLRTAGEDGLFKTTLAAKQPRVCVSTHVGARSGEGVNIFTEGAWGSRKAVERSLYHCWSRLLMRPLVAGQPRARAHLDQATALACREVAASVLGSLRRNGLSDLPGGLLRRVLAEDPRIGWQWLRQAARLATRRGHTA